MPINAIVNTIDSYSFEHNEFSYSIHVPDVDDCRLCVQLCVGYMLNQYATNIMLFYIYALSLILISRCQQSCKHHITT